MSDLSYQIGLNNLQMKSLVIQSFAGSSDSQAKNTAQIVNTFSKNIQEAQNIAIYSIEGDSKYNSDIDNDSDGIITFNEYVQYLTQQKLEKSSNALKNLARFTKTTDSTTGLEKITITDIGRAIRSYVNNLANVPEAKISAKA